MAPVVYQDLLSPCSRAVALVVRKAGLESVVQFKYISLASGDAMKPEFVQKFPLHAVPSLEDDGFYLWDSHAIVAYLISAYANDDALYPKDPKKRAKVDQWLHYSNATLYNRLRDMSEPIWKRERKDVSDERKQRVGAALKDLETILGDKQWLCGDQLTLADICCAAQTIGAKVLYGDISHFKTLTAWLERCQAALPGWKELCVDPNDIYRAALDSLMSS